jgi:ankyrin repeat protein
LHYAIQGGSDDVLLWLLKDHSLSALLPDNLGRTATHIAANKCSLHALQTLHEFRQLCFNPAEDGSTPLHIAARMDGIDVAQLLLAAGHPMDVSDLQGNSPLHVAAREQHLGMLNLLVTQQGNIDVYDSTGASPLMICVGNGLYEVTESLLKRGASALHRDYCGRSCLHILLLQMPHEQPHQLVLQQKLAALLIEHGIDVNARDTSGCTPCHIAAKSGNIEMLKFFMDNNGDVTLTDLSGKSCLVQLNREHFHQVTQILIDRIKFPSTSYRGVSTTLSKPWCQYLFILHSLRNICAFFSKTDS